MFHHVLLDGLATECDTLFAHCTTTSEDPCYDPIATVFEQCQNDTCGCSCYYAIESYIESTWNFTDNYDDYEGYCDECNTTDSEATCPTYTFLTEFCSFVNNLIRNRVCTVFCCFCFCNVFLLLVFASTNAFSLTPDFQPMIVCLLFYSFFFILFCFF